MEENDIEMETPVADTQEQPQVKLSDLSVPQKIAILVEKTLDGVLLGHIRIDTAQDVLQLVAAAKESAPVTPKASS